METDNFNSTLIIPTEYDNTEEINTKDDESSLDRIAFLQNVEEYLWKHVTLSLVAIGIIGNTLTIVILKRPGMRSSSSVILMTLAVADTLALMIGPFEVYLQKNHDINPESYRVGCKINKFFKFVLGYNANWLIIIFTIFRVIAVYLPHKANIHCTRKRAYIAILVTFMTCCILHLDLLIHIDMVPSFNRRGQFVGSRCWFEGPRYTYYTYHQRWVLLAEMSLAPFTILLIGNSMIIYKMVKHNIKRKRMSSDNKSNDSQSMTAMLISISILFLVTQTPAIVTSMLKNNLENEPRTKVYLYTFTVIDSACRLLRWSNNAVNFFCYCISGRRFREELMATMKGLVCWKQNSDTGADVTNSTATT